MASDAATAAAGGCGPGYGVSRVPKPRTEVGPVRFRDPEQLADHGERQRERVTGHQVDDAVGAAAGRQVGEQILDDRPDAGLQRVDPPPAERGHGQPAQPRVVRRVDDEHVPGQRRPRKALGDDLSAARQRGVHVLGQPRVVQRRPGLLVTDDQPGRVPVGEGDLVYRPGGPHLREQRERVVAVVVTPRVERRDGACALSSFPISRKPEHNRSITASWPSTTLQTAVWVQTQRIVARPT